MLYFLTILVSTLLYRSPRGGGLGEGRTTEGRLLWAFPTALLLCEASGSYWPIAIGFLLWAGIAPGWSKWWPNNGSGGSLSKLNLRGALLLNPVMGYIYFYFYKNKEKYKMNWTELSEFASGFVTATAYTALTYLGDKYVF